MGVISNTVDLYYTYKFLRTLTSRWEDIPAYKYGIIDNKGKVLRKRDSLTKSEELDTYTYFDRLCWKLKRLMEKTPLIGQMRLTSFAASLWLLMEHCKTDIGCQNPREFEKVFMKVINQNFTYDVVKKQLKEATDYSYSHLPYILPGLYRIKGSDLMFFVEETIHPVGRVLGYDVYDLNEYCYVTIDKLEKIKEDAPVNSVATAISYAQEKDPRIASSNDEHSINISRKNKRRKASKNKVFLFKTPNRQLST